MTVVTAALAFAARAAVFTLLAPPSFRGSSYLWPLLILAGGLFAVGQTAALLTLTRGGSRLLVRPGIAMSGGAILLNVVTAWAFGVPGVVAANVCYTAVYAAWNVRIAAAAAAERGEAPSPGEGPTHVSRLVVERPVG